MCLIHLEISNLRNIETATLQPSPHLNIIVGSNGSGKTTLLESIHLLSRAKSFRTRYLSQLIADGSRQATVFCRIQASGLPDPVARKKMGIALKRGEPTEIRVEGRTPKTSSELARLLPLLTITTETVALLKEGPQNRRRFIDWGVFHVEPAFAGEWQRYSRALRQKNALLKQPGAGRRDAQAWDSELCDSAGRITEMRRHYIQLLEKDFIGYLEALLGPEWLSTTLSYEQGWPEESDLMTILAEGFESDRDAGHTQRGPHRADLLVKRNRKTVAHFASAGQQKLIVCALYLAQLALFGSKTGQSCVVLIDDLPAELDEANRNRFLQLLTELNNQLFVTATEPQLIRIDKIESKKLFHVEQGRIKPLESF
jgi:DNA replication and repair protein RecF